MQYKNILVFLDQGVSNPERVNTAISIAQAHKARLTGVYVNPLPRNGFMQKFSAGATEQSVAQQADAIAQSAFDQFSSAASEAGVASETRLIACPENQAPRQLARIARVFDLAILRQANPDRPQAGFITELCEEVMFSSGRPVVYIPYIGAHAIPCKRGLVAWDGSKAATRAIHDALPLLEQMEMVEILVVDPDKVEHYASTKPGEAISAHLSEHGIENRVSRVLSGDTSTSTVILNEITNKGADMLVMGGYGTPKLREVILGGVTRTLMECMTVPVFMSH